MSHYLNPGLGVGLRNVGSYQVSGHPYVTGSADMGSAGTEVKVSFPFVTKEVTVFASGSNSQLKVGFQSDSNGTVFDSAPHHYVSLSNGDSGTPSSFTFDVKCKEVYVKNVNANAGFEVYASLTGIQTGSMYVLTGSGITDA